uniref:Uncharacterized protein n=1 Tax=Arundo donax TaxID=35708 RepID=A0A0A9H3Q5_ARUDO
MYCFTFQPGTLLVCGKNNLIL